MDYKFVTIQMPNSNWIIRRDTMTDDGQTCIEQAIYRQFDETWWTRASCEHALEWFATQYHDKPSEEFLKKIGGTNESS